MADDLKSKVLAWFTKTGYPLELFTYQTLVDNGFITAKSPLFADSKNGKSREIDIFASISKDFSNYTFTLELVVECKRSDKPLIILCADSVRTGKFEQLLGSKRTYPILESSSLTSNSTRCP